MCHVLHAHKSVIFEGEWHLTVCQYHFISTKVKVILKVKISLFCIWQLSTCDTDPLLDRGFHHCGGYRWIIESKPDRGHDLEKQCLEFCVRLCFLPELPLHWSEFTSFRYLCRNALQPYFLLICKLHCRSEIKTCWNVNGNKAKFFAFNRNFPFIMSVQNLKSVCE